MTSTADFYEVLDIPEDSSPEAIPRPDMAQMKKWYPDKHPLYSKVEEEANFKAISQANEALQYPENRSVFGEYGNVAAGVGDKAWASYKAPQSLVPTPRRDEQFTPMPTTPRPRPARSFRAFTFSGSMRRKPPTVERKLECTLEELCLGCNKVVNFSRDVVTKEGTILRKQETQTIKVKPGWKKGTKIIFGGAVDPDRPGCLAADIVFVVAEMEHPMFKRVDNDLILKVAIPVVNALTGWSFAFRLLTGEKISCSFAEEIIYPGYEKLIRGHGMPIINKNKGVRGDLRIKFNIVFPKQLNKEQRARIREVLKDSI